MNYSQIKKLDEETLEKLTEGSGPVDECICSLLSPPEGERKSIKESIKKAFAAFGTGKDRKGKNDRRGREQKRQNVYGQNSVDIPLTFTKGGKGISTTREVVKRKSSCGKCGCDNENIVLKHSIANIRITTPDVSSFCPCDSDCLPDKDKLQNNIQVTIEHVAFDNDLAGQSSLSEFSDDSRLTAISPIEEQSETSQLTETPDTEQSETSQLTETPDTEQSETGQLTETPDTEQSETSQLTETPDSEQSETNHLTQLPDTEQRRPVSCRRS